VAVAIDGSRSLCGGGVHTRPGLRLDLASDTGLELLQGRWVVVQREPVTDHDVGPEHAGGEEVSAQPGPVMTTAFT